MKLLNTTTIAAGMVASITIAVLMLFLPRLFGQPPVDLTAQFGAAFSTASPHLTGSVFLAILGIIYAVVYGLFQPMLPGNYITKGALYGILVGFFSLIVLPSIIAILDNMIGAPNQYVAEQFSLGTQGIITLAAYAVFGITLAMSYRPSSVS